MNVDQAKKALSEGFGDSLDLAIVESTVCGRCALYAFVDGMSDRVLLEQGIMQPLVGREDPVVDERTLNRITYSSAQFNRVENFDEAQTSIAEGNILLFVEPDLFFEVNLAKYPKRAIMEPPTATVLKGPREGFVEDLAQNTTLLRRRLRDRSLIIRERKVGRLSHTRVAICWLSTVADERVVDEITRRIEAIDIDAVLDSSYVGQLIEDNPHSLFTQYGSQEKPDIVAAKLLEGRVAVIVDGSPMVLTFPCLFIEGFQDSEDYYRKSKRTTLLRMVRLICVAMSVLLPALYVAMQEYHYQLLPLKFLITVIKATNGVPFNPTTEMFVVLLLFEVLNEASVRMPKYVGMALSIVGAIVLGETAVNAGLLSSPAVLVMALSAIGMYTTPNNAGPFSIMRLVFLLFASLLGLVGVIAAVSVFVCYTVTMTNYGTDYVAPIAPLVAGDLKDSLIKAPIEDMEERPYSLPNKNRRRFKKGGK